MPSPPPSGDNWEQQKFQMQRDMDELSSRFRRALMEAAAAFGDELDQVMARFESRKQAHKPDETEWNEKNGPPPAARENVVRLDERTLSTLDEINTNVAAIMAILPQVGSH